MVGERNGVPPARVDAKTDAPRRQWGGAEGRMGRGRRPRPYALLLGSCDDAAGIVSKMSFTRYEDHKNADG